MLGIFLLMGLLLIGAAGASFFFFMQAKKREQQQQLPPGYAGTFTPAKQLAGSQGGAAHDVGGVNIMNLSLGTIVSHFGTDYIVEGRLTHWEDGYTWLTYMLVDGSSKRWLSVEDDDGLEVSLWDPAHNLPLQNPPPEFIDYNGERFRMVEKGQARVNQEGKTGNKMGQHVDYFEYEGQGDSALSVERWGNSLEASIGKVINPAELEILPGDLVEY